MNDARIIDRSALDLLVEVLRDRGYAVVGPTLRSQAIVYGELSCAADLAVGWADEQDGGTYRLRRRDDDAVFGHNVGPQLAQGLPVPAPARAVACTAGRRRRSSRWSRRAEPPRYAFFGVRACDIAAVGDPGPGVHRRPLRRRATTRPGAATRSSSRSTAASRGARASACRWTPVRRPSRASTSH